MVIKLYWIVMQSIQASPTQTCRTKWWSMHKNYVKNRTATLYCSLVQWFMYKYNTINLWPLPYKCFVMQNYSDSCSYWHSILGWYSQPCYEEWIGRHYVCLAHAVDTISNTDEDRLRIIRLARKMPRHMIKKVFT